MYHSTNVRTPSAIGIILAASDISGLTDLGELPAWVLEWMSLPERVKNVQATNQVMFHWSKHSSGHPNDSRGDTSTYQWAGKAARAVIANPAGALRGNKDQTFQVIGATRPHPKYSDLGHIRLILKYVPSSAPTNASGTPELCQYLHPTTSA